MYARIGGVVKCFGKGVLGDGFRRGEGGFRSDGFVRKFLFWIFPEIFLKKI
jgi:hypothetical protein